MGDQGNERNETYYDKSKAAPLKCQNDENIECGGQNTGQQRQAAEKLQRGGGAQDLGKVTGGDSDLANHPEKQTGTARIVFAARLGQVTSGGNPQLCREGLQKHGHQVADEDDTEKRVSEL